MNVEALTKVAEWLEGGAKHVTDDGRVTGFHMEYWVSEKDAMCEDDAAMPWVGECGSVMCIGGALEQFSRETGTPADLDYGLSGDDVGLDSDVAHDLFYPWDSDSWTHRISPEDLNPENCAKVIRHLIATGEVDWSIIAPAKEEVSA